MAAVEAAAPSILDEPDSNPSQAREWAFEQRFLFLSWNRLPGCGDGMFYAVKDGHLTLFRGDCKRWGCGYCGPRKQWRYAFAIARIAAERGLVKFLTLTLPGDRDQTRRPADVAEETMPVAVAAWSKLLMRLRRAYGKFDFVRVVEFQADGTAHLHVLLPRWVVVGHSVHDIAWVRREWQAVGGGWADIKMAAGEEKKLARYISKYLAKDMLVAPHGSRRIAVARGVCLIEKAVSEGIWEFTSASIESVEDAMRSHGMLSATRQCDCDGLLQRITYDGTAAGEVLKALLGGRSP